MSKRKRPPRSARSRISGPRGAKPDTRRHSPAKTTGSAGAEFWLYGLHAVRAALTNSERKKHRLIVSPQAHESLASALSDGSNAGLAHEMSDRAELDAVCGPEAVHQGVALLVSPLPELSIEDILEEGDDADRTILMLDQATDPRNIGAVMRSARAFGVGSIIVQDRHTPSETGVMAKAASGALEHVQLVRVTNLARALWTLKDADYWSVGLDGRSETDIGTVEFSGKNVIVLGAEGAGLRRLTRETCDQLARIPIDEDAESLNLSNAAAIALYIATQNR